MDDDIVLDFAVPERLVGIGVRQASKRLDLDHLLPHAEVLRREEALWPRLRGELLRRKTADEPVKTLLHGVAYWVQEVGPDYVYLRTDRGRGKSHRINADEIQDKNTEKYVGKRAAHIRLAGHSGLGKGVRTPSPSTATNHWYLNATRPQGPKPPRGGASYRRHKNFCHRHLDGRRIYEPTQGPYRFYIRRESSVIFSLLRGEYDP